jgi:hypothetical protein
MKRYGRAGAATFVAVLACAGAAAPAGAATRVVHPGQSIQAAIDAASAGDTIVVKPGTYREYLQIIDKDRITLRGQHARLKAPSTPSTSLCDQDEPGSETGICVAGRVGPPVGENPPPVLRQAVRDRVTGFRISGFETNGVFGYGTRRLRIDRNRFVGNGEYGVFSNTSTRTRLERNVAVGNKGEAALYVGDSQGAHALVSRNQVVGNRGIGIFIRDASHGRVSHNRSSRNCAGIIVLGDAPGPVAHWTLSFNRVGVNNRACPGNPDEGESPLSGLGIGLSGAQHVRVAHNRVLRNRHLHKSPISGGIVVEKGDMGTNPDDVLVSRNVALLNRPFDLKWDGSGDVTFSKNVCQKGDPSRLCP